MKKSKKTTLNNEDIQKSIFNKRLAELLDVLLEELNNPEKK